MAYMTLADAEAALLTVNVAISDLLSGKRITELDIGSGTFKRRYKFAEITLDNLYMLRNEYRSIIANLQPSIKPVFRVNCNIPIIVEKGNY
jgi:hypothetical protein